MKTDHKIQNKHYVGEFTKSIILDEAQSNQM